MPATRNLLEAKLSTRKSEFSDAIVTSKSVSSGENSSVPNALQLERMVSLGPGEKSNDSNAATIFHEFGQYGHGILNQRMPWGLTYQDTLTFWENFGTISEWPALLDQIKLKKEEWWENAGTLSGATYFTWEKLLGID